MQRLKLLYTISLAENETLADIDYIFSDGDRKNYVLPAFKTALLRQWEAMSNWLLSLYLWKKTKNVAHKFSSIS